MRQSKIAVIHSPSFRLSHFADKITTNFLNTNKIMKKIRKRFKNILVSDNPVKRQKSDLQQLLIV